MVTTEQVIRKVYAYITSLKGQLLVFDHLDFPEAGVQVPGGIVEPREPEDAAVMRQAEEEIGLSNLRLVQKLGVSHHNMAELGLSGIHERHYYDLTLPHEERSEWIGYEETPSDGSPSPITLRFYWIDIDQAGVLSGGLEEMIPHLMESAQ